MGTNVVVVLTCRGKTRILKEKCSQAWRLDATRVAKLEYVVCVQNRKMSWGNPEAAHHSAFMVAKISGVSPSTEKDSEGRWRINISEYADIEIPDMWDGNRNPVSYASISDLGINVNELVFKALDEEMPKRIDCHNKGVEKISIQEAKSLLAESLGISEEQITITINA